jgi:hypothetical protein
MIYIEYDRRERMYCIIDPQADIRLVGGAIGLAEAEAKARAYTVRVGRPDEEIVLKHRYKR